MTYNEFGMKQEWTWTGSGSGLELDSRISLSNPASGMELDNIVL